MIDCALPLIKQGTEGDLLVEITTYVRISEAAAWVAAYIRPLMYSASGRESFLPSREEGRQDGRWQSRRRPADACLLDSSMHIHACASLASGICMHVDASSCTCGRAREKIKVRRSRLEDFLCHGDTLRFGPNLRVIMHRLPLLRLLYDVQDRRGRSTRVTGADVSAMVYRLMHGHRRGYESRRCSHLHHHHRTCMENVKQD